VTTLLAFAFVLGVLVFVHELGHFLAAKRVGIRVLKFQLGFNPTVLSIRRGDTEYSIGALPLGGYVKMAGENPDDVRTGKDDEFLSKTKWQRFQVLIMGPVMNIALALVLTAVVLYQGVEKFSYEDQPPIVGVVIPHRHASMYSPWPFGSFPSAIMPSVRSVVPMDPAANNSAWSLARFDSQEADATARSLLM